MDNRQVDLYKYRIQESKDTLKVAENCLRDTFYKDAINRSYGFKWDTGLSQPTKNRISHWMSWS